MVPWERRAQIEFDWSQSTREILSLRHTFAALRTFLQPAVYPVADDRSVNMIPNETTDCSRCVLAKNLYSGIHVSRNERALNIEFHQVKPSGCGSNGETVQPLNIC